MGSARAEEDLSRSGLAGSAIPAALASLIGRAPDLDGVSNALRRCRLVTVSGAGGVGKTSLATEVARRQVPRRRDGVWLVDLTGGPRTPKVAVETARALGLQTPGGTSAVDALRRYLAERDALVVLDKVTSQVRCKPGRTQAPRRALYAAAVTASVDSVGTSSTVVGLNS